MAQDSETINENEAYELAYAADKFGTAKWEVMKAIEEGGSNDRDDVQNYILSSRYQDLRETRETLAELINIVEKHPHLNVHQIANLLHDKNFTVKKREV